MVDVRNAGIPPRRPHDEGPGPRVMGAWMAGVVAVCIGATFVPGWIAEAGNPREVVDDFFSALRNGDAERALDLIEPSEIPSGKDAAFLVPDALNDDWTVEIPQERHDWDWDRGDTAVDIPVTIGSAQGVAETTVSLAEDSGDWKLRQVLATVTFAPSPLAHHQVNGHIPAPQSHREGGPGVTEGGTYRLFPGVYRFFDNVDGIVNVNGRDTVIEPGTAYQETLPPHIMVGPMRAGKHAVEEAQLRFNALLDECANATVMSPPGCPFGTGEYIDTDDGQRVHELTALSWEVEKYPTISLEDDRSVPEDEETASHIESGFAVVTVKPGAMTLSGTGVNTDDKTVDFDISCEILASSMRAHLHQDGEIELASASQQLELEEADTSDTCLEEGGS